MQNYCDINQISSYQGMGSVSFPEIRKILTEREQERTLGAYRNILYLGDGGSYMRVYIC